MEFEEFEKQCSENLEFNEGTCCWDETWIDGLCLSIDKVECGYEIETYSCVDSEDGTGFNFVYSHQVVLGSYTTLRKTYNALVKICKLNNVEF
jgi:hypothetical protein